MFNGLGSNSVALSHMWLGLLTRRLLLQIVHCHFTGIFSHLPVGEDQNAQPVINLKRQFL